MQRIIATLIILTSALRAETEDFLTAYWNYENNLDDTATAGNTADNGSWLNGSNANFQPGFLGQGFTTNGSAYIAVPNSNDINGAGNSISVSSWFRIGSFDKNWQCLISQGEGNKWRVARSSGSETLAYAGGRSDVTAGPNVNDGAWHHVLAVTQNGVGTRIYIDGAFANDNPGSVNLDTSSSQMFIGENVDAGGRQWDGQIDDTGIFNTSLNDFEATAIYDLAVDATYQFSLREVNELFKLQTCPDGSTVQIGSTTWEAVSGDPGDGRDFYQLSNDGSGVAGSDGPVINSFSADFTTIPTGYNVTLSWDVDPTATAISINQGIGNVFPETANGIGNLTLNPGPSSDIVYTLNVTNALGSSTRDLNIQVTDQPIIQRFSASPLSIEPGQNVTLSWATLNTTSLTLDGVPVAASGSQVFQPAVSTTYTLEATNANGSVSETATVAVFINGEPIISEFSATNDGSNVDEDGDDSDWIEITNYTASPTLIDGTYFLTDDPDDPDKWAIPNQTIPAGGRIVIFASGKDRTSPNMHTNFSLNSDGEYLALRRIQGGTVTLLSEFDDYPRQFFGLSYGVISPDLSTYKYLAIPSPGGENSGTSYGDFTRDTNFSVKRGIFTSGQSVVISTATVDAEIRYTLDGTTPSPTVGTVYNGPVPITSTTTLRAIASKPGFVPTNVDTHTYIFPSDVINQPASPANWPPPTTNGQWLDYEMDAASNVGVTDQVLIDALKAIPSLSIVTDQDSLTGGSGIYVNAGNRGTAWERPASLEMILPPGVSNPDGLTENFQQDGGLRIRGGFSRSNANPKHALRMLFKREYGSSRLRYPLFGNEGDDEFEAIDFRTSQNYSWAFQNDSKNTFLREVFGRDSQRDMGQSYTRSRYYHLYLNGLYWGLYMTQERVNADYAAQYFPGGDDEFDVVKSGGSSQGYNTETIDGTNTDWMTGYNLAKNINGTSNVGGVNIPNYNLLQGLDENGLRDPSLPVLVDMENLITYMLTVFYTGSFDAPLSTFIGASNNWFGLRNHERGEQGWSFYAHDMEHSLGTNNNSINRVGSLPYSYVNQTFTKSNPQYLHQFLASNEEYRLLFADIAHREFANDGAFTNANVLARIGSREATVTQVIDAEAARWGDAKRSTPFRRSNWVSAVNSLKSWVNNRNNTVQGQLESVDLFPDFGAPVFGQHGGQVASGFTLDISAPDGGTNYYTTDGSDPRDTGIIGSSVIINDSITVKSRIRSGGDWSALTSADFIVGTTPGAGDLIISEINYHPSDPTPAEIEAGFTDDDDFEFIELRNTSGGPVDLSDVTLVTSSGDSFVFATLPSPSDAVLAPGEHLVLTYNLAGFSFRYPGITAYGDYEERLSNNSDTLELKLGDGTVLFSVTYSDSLGWPEAADGDGYTLVFKPEALPVDTPSSWRLSKDLGGNPDANDTEPFLGDPNGDDNGNGISNLVEAVLNDGAGTYIAPTVGTINLPDGGVNEDFATLTIRRYIPVDNTAVIVEKSEDLSSWSGNEIVLVTSFPNGDGTMTETYRSTIPLTDQDQTYFRAKVVKN